MLALEKLHRALVLLGCGSAGKSAEVSPSAGPGIEFSRVQPVLARLQLANHGYACRYHEAAIAWRRAIAAIDRVARRPGSRSQRCPAVPVGSGDKQWSRRSPPPSSLLAGCLRP